MYYSFTPYLDFQAHTSLLGSFGSSLAWGDKERPGEFGSDGHSHNYAKAKDLYALLASNRDTLKAEVEQVKAKKAELEAIPPKTKEDADWRTYLLKSIQAKLDALSAELSIREDLAKNAWSLKSHYENTVVQWTDVAGTPHEQVSAALKEAAAKWHPYWESTWSQLVLGFYKLRDHMIKNLAIYPWAPEVYAYLDQVGSGKDYAPDSQNNPLMKHYDPCVPCIAADIEAFKKGVLAADFESPEAVCQGRDFEVLDRSYGSKGIVKWEWRLHSSKPQKATQQSGIPFKVVGKSLKPGKYDLELRVTDSNGTVSEPKRKTVEICKPKAGCKCCMTERAKDGELDETLSILEQIAHPPTLMQASWAVADYAQAIKHYLGGSGKYRAFVPVLLDDMAAHFRDSLVVQPFLEIQKRAVGEVAGKLLATAKKKKKAGQPAVAEYDVTVKCVVPIKNKETIDQLSGMHALFGPAVHAVATVRATVQQTAVAKLAVECRLVGLGSYVVDNVDFNLAAEKFTPVFTGIGEEVSILSLDKLQKACCVRAYQRSTDTYHQPLILVDDNAEEVIAAAIPESHSLFEVLHDGPVDVKMLLDAAVNATDVELQSGKVVFWADLKTTLNNFGGKYTARVYEYVGTNPKLIGTKYMILRLPKSGKYMSKIYAWLSSYPAGIQQPGAVHTMRALHWEVSTEQAALKGLRKGWGLSLLLAVPFEIIEEMDKEQFSWAAVIGGLGFEFGTNALASAAGLVTVPILVAAGATSVVVASGIGIVVAVVTGLFLAVTTDEMKQSWKDKIREWAISHSYGEHSYGLPEYPGGAQPWLDVGCDELVYRLSEPWEVIYKNAKHLKYAKKKLDNTKKKEIERAKKLKSLGRLPAPGPASHELPLVAAEAPPPVLVGPES